MCEGSLPVPSSDVGSHCRESELTVLEEHRAEILHYLARLHFDVISHFQADMAVLRRAGSLLQLSTVSQFRHPHGRTHTVPYALCPSLTSSASSVKWMLTLPQPSQSRHCCPSSAHSSTALLARTVHRQYFSQTCFASTSTPDALQTTGVCCIKMRERLGSGDTQHSRTDLLPSSFDAPPDRRLCRSELHNKLFSPTSPHLGRSTARLLLLRALAHLPRRDTEMSGPSSQEPHDRKPGRYEDRKLLRSLTKTCK